MASDSWDGPVLSAVRCPPGNNAPLAYHDGVQAIVEIAARFSGDAWDAATPCAEWRAADLAGHLRCVADDYHEYLDDAPVSRLARLLASGADPEAIAEKVARQNAAELATLPDVPPGEHIAAFAESAVRYAARLDPLLALPHHSYRGQLVTVAGMACAACVEWHVHAWDLAWALGENYRPADPQAVHAAWLAGAVGRPLPPPVDPWLAVLRACGRRPGQVALARRNDPQEPPAWLAGGGGPQVPVVRPATIRMTRTADLPDRVGHRLSGLPSLARGWASSRCP